MPWYEFFQNANAGEHICNDKLCAHILIQAENCEEANCIAESLGMCFETQNDYEHSPCRWERCCYELEFPSKWDKFVFETPEEYSGFIYNRRHKVGANHTRPHSRLYYHNGHCNAIGE